MGKRKKLHSIITKEDRELVVNSEAINNYPELKRVLDKYERIYKTDFEDTDDFDDKLINLMLYVFQDIRDECEKEWYSNGKMDVVESDNQEDWVKCALCGTPNKYIYYIVNRLNKTKLNVGSDCIDKFSSIDTRLPEGMTMEKLKTKQIKDYEKLKRKEDFNKKFPGTEKMLVNWYKEYYNLPIILPTELHRELTSVYNEGKATYNKYINGKDIETGLYKFQELINMRKQLMGKANKFIEENKCKKFICTKEIYDWLIKNDSLDLLNEIRDNYSILPIYIVPLIYEDDFINDMLIYFKKMMDNTKITITKLEGINIYFEFKDKKQRLKCELYISKRKFMSLYGKRLNETNYKLKEDDLLSQLKVVPTENNYTVLINELEKILIGTDYDINYESMEKGLEFTDKINDTYVHGFLTNVFLNAQKKKVLLKGDNYKENICRVIKNMKKWRPLSHSHQAKKSNICFMI